MHLRMDGEGRHIDRLIPLHNFAFIIDQNEVADTNVAEVNAEGIDPEMIRAFGVAGRDVPGNAFIKPELRE